MITSIVSVQLAARKEKKEEHGAYHEITKLSSLTTDISPMVHTCYRIKHIRVQEST